MATPYLIREPLLVLRDMPRAPVDVLEQYYNDVFKLLLGKLIDFDRASVLSIDEGKKLQALLTELIKVRAQLQASSPSA